MKRANDIGGSPIGSAKATAADDAAILSLLASRLGLANMPTVHLVQAPPALITRLNSEAHLGIKGDAYIVLLRDMALDAAFRGEVIKTGKLRAATPEAVIRYLNARPQADEGEGVEDEEDGEDSAESVRRELGYERAPKARKQASR